MTELPAPAYARGDNLTGVGLAVESMRRHTSNEGFELFQGLEHAGYALAGHGLTTRSEAGKVWVQHRPDLTDVREILGFTEPGIVVLQDKREWEGRTAGGPRGFDQRERFRNVGALKGRDDVFKLTILKDAQSSPEYHRESAEEIGCHAWVVYYDPDVVAALAPFVRRRHLVRTWHSVDPANVPDFSDRRPDGSPRAGTLLSGAVSASYPLRTRLFRELESRAGRMQGPSQSSGVTVLRHPGYHRRGCQTPAFLQELARHRVAICTCSVYRYALRKIVEATAAGCVVVTNLPASMPMPEIDANLVRVSDQASVADVIDVCRSAEADWDHERQTELAARAVEWYNFRQVGLRLARDIETLRRSYEC